jgi:hypothetical protein
MLGRPFGGGVIGNTAGSGPVVEGSSPSPRADALIGRRRILTAAVALGVGACSGSPRRPAPIAPTPRGQGKPLKIGCIAPFSGARSYIGARAKASLLAAVMHIDTDLGGAFGSYRPDVLTADAPLAAADGQRAYSVLKGAGVDAILWCGAPGLPESVPQIVRDLMPVIAVGTDLQSQSALNPEIPDLTTRAASGFPIFQLGLGDAMAMNLLVGYLGSRKVKSAALIFSPIDFPGADVIFAGACQSLGVGQGPVVALNPPAPSATTSTTSAISTSAFITRDVTIDVSSALTTIHRSGAEALVVFTLPEEAAEIDAALDSAGWRYVDAAAAKGSFRPMVVGGPTGVGDPQFSMIAGKHAASGTLSVDVLGQYVGLPSVPVRDWLGRFVPSHPVTGGEVAPADALGALLVAAGEAGAVDGASLVAALEAGVPTQFASVVPFAFSAQRHLSFGADDLVVTTLEAPGESRYTMGKSSVPGPQLLVDYTLAANSKSDPSVMSAVLAGKWGSSCRPDYQRASQVAACRAVH